MSSVAEQFVEIATTTISKWSKKVANNVLKSNAVFGKLYDKKRVVSGGKDLQFSIKYARNPNVKSFKDYDKFVISPHKQFGEARYDWAAYNTPITFSDFEIAKNASEEKMVDLIKSRLKAAEEDTITLLNEHLYLDGTGNDNKDILGLAALVADSPATGIVGGIDRAVDTFWQNKAAAASGAWGSATNLYARKDTDKMFTDIRVGKTVPDLNILGSYAFRGMKAELESVERGKTDFAKRKSWGFVDFDFNGMDGCYDEACPAGKSYLLNTEYMQLTVHNQYNFKPIAAQRPDDSAAFVQHIRVFLQLTTDRPAAHGVITGITAA